MPFTANATQTIVTAQTPAAVGSDGTVSMAATSGPYQTATIGEHDDEHIATTAYVKGAYNDAIRAVNKLDSDKQNQLINMQNNHDISTKVFHADLGGLPRSMQTMNSDEYAAMYADISRYLSNDESNTALDDTLMSAGTILQLMHTKTMT